MGDTHIRWNRIAQGQRWVSVENPSHIGAQTLATLTRDDEILGSATINNGTANITFAAPGTTGTATLTVFGYNKITYIATIDITNGGVTQYTIDVSANPSHGGTVTGGGTYQQGQSCTVSASANAGYTFSNWTENGTVVSTTRTYTFTVTSNRTLVANFTAQSYTITVAADPTMGGTVSGGGTFTYGQDCTVTATTNEGYTFHHWLENGNVVSTQASYTFTVTGNRNLVAIFTPHVYTIFAVPSPPEGGNAEGSGSYDYGQTCTVVATPNEGYDFINWTEDGNPVSTETNFSFTVTGSRMLTANFEAQTFDIKVSIDPADAATVTGEGNYAYGTEVTLTLLRNEDYLFVNWTEDGEVVSEEMTYVFTITRDRTLIANFVYTEGVGEQQAEINVYPNPTQGEVTLEGEGIDHVRIVNMYGQTVYDAKAEGEQIRIDLSNLAKGIYMMHVGTENGQVVKQIVVE